MEFISQQFFQKIFRKQKDKLYQKKDGERSFFSETQKKNYEKKDERRQMENLRKISLQNGG